MEEVFRWLASWVSADTNNSNGSGGTVRATDFKDIAARDTHSDILKQSFADWRMGPPASFVRLAGVSGALAIGFGAYGAHGIRENPDISRERILAFDTGNRYHLIHSVALLAAPMSKYPVLTGALLALGTTLFSGTCYYYAVTGQTEVRRITPYGGMILIVAWLSFVA